ncbi:DMT family transporter [Candidatus Gottesmanbacteria bacterium]|nr:DMT family transporter [Candidatus Gottesmanbacteria bacterium]
MIFVYFVSFLAGILWGTTESINKNITEKQYSSFSYFLIQMSLNLLLYAIPFIMFGTIPRQPIVYFYLIVPVIFILLGNLFLIKAYKTEDISNINILSRSSLIITFLTGVFLLHEKVSVWNIAGIVIIVLGMLTISYEGKRIKPSIGFLLALASGVLMGALAYFRKLALYYINPISVVFSGQLFMTIILLLIPKSYQDVKPIWTKYKKRIILSRFTAVSGFYLINWSFSQGNISIANTNYETAFLLSTLLIGIWILHEKKNTRKKLIGSFLCILGIILLNFF